jgi:phage terminase Nu1 subunit (DNA packaging protein)
MRSQTLTEAKAQARETKREAQRLERIEKAHMAMYWMLNDAVHGVQLLPHEIEHYRDLQRRAHG